MKNILNASEMRSMIGFNEWWMRKVQEHDRDQLDHLATLC